MSEYPTYLVHFGIKGQKWGQRRYQNEDGSYTPEGKIRYTKQGYKDLKKQYKINVKNATHEFKKVRKESGYNRFFGSKQHYRTAISKVDDFAYKKVDELYNQYKNLKVYKAKIKGKDFDTSKARMKTYFRHIGVAPFLNKSFASANIDYDIMPDPTDKNKKKNLIYKNINRTYVY